MEPLDLTLDLPLDLIIVGAGITGMAIAARASSAGLRVVLVEQHATVGQGASFAHGGLMLPSPLDAWFGPGPRDAEPGGLPWRRKAREQAADASRFAQAETLRGLAVLSQTALAEVIQEHELEFEACHGGIYLFHSDSTLARAKALSPALLAAGFAHRLLTPEACRDLAPGPTGQDAGRGGAAPLTGGLLLDDLSSGNCALATKRLKTKLEERGVIFMLARQVTALRLDRTGASIEMKRATAAAGAFSGVQAMGFTAPSPDRLLNAAAQDRDGVQQLRAKRVVLAAGSGCGALLTTAGVTLPLNGRTTRAITGAIAHDEAAPRRILIDAERGISMVRFEQRLRISTTIATKANGPLTDKTAASLTQALHQCADERIPGAARLNTEAVSAEHVCGEDGLPVIGPQSWVAHSAGGRTQNRLQKQADMHAQALAQKQALAAMASGRPRDDRAENDLDDRLYVAIAGTAQGWALAFGAAEIIVRRIRGLPSDALDSAFSPGRFR